ncbi:MAG: NPCBM/NEW2 domain-containing protein [Phycisphaerae bacterium]|nr:NPCBM/NEW2 domain-containing protein [Phycisphaerae bacterium]
MTRQPTPTGELITNPRATPLVLPAPAGGWLWPAWAGIWAESLTLLAAGFLFLTFLQTKPGGENHDLIGVRDHDGWYHTKMASLLPTIGATQEFPWLQFVYFRQSSDKFVSHHFGFHVLLLPFLAAAKWITGDILPGGRWAVAACFGGILVIANLLMRHLGVPYRWLWFALVLILPHQFFLRLGYVRAIAPSLMLMLLLCYFLTTRRAIAAGVTIALYNQLYLGGVMFAGVIVAVFFACDFIGPAGDRRFSIKMLASCAIGWLVGVFGYPYASGMYEFLLLQVFGTGLSPDIEVGQEWKPYQGVWWFIEMAGPLLAVWSLALLLRLRFGPTLSGPETAMLVLNFGFLLLTCKARRFIEYWPAFGWLSAAALAGPVLAKLAEWWARDTEDEPEPAVMARAIAIWVGLGLVSVLAALAIYRDVPYLSQWLRQPRFDPARELLLDTRFRAAVLLVAAMAWVRAVDLPRLSAGRYFARLGDAVLVTALLLVCTISVSAPALASTRNDLRSDYDTVEIKQMMAAIEADSKPGDIIFTDDWDCFGVYFYHNSKNHYIVGLDPKFTQDRRPDLWERYVKVTRGQAPANSKIHWRARGGKKARDEEIRVDLHDIRDHFRARYVIVDDDHKPLARQLAKDVEFAELIYPCKTYADCDDAKYLVFRVRDAAPAASRSAAGETEAASGANAASGTNAALPGEIRYLCDLSPRGSAVEGAAALEGQPVFQCNKSLRGGTLRAGSQSHLRGIAQRGDSKVEIALPPGFERFEAALGATGYSAGQPVRVQVWLDGEMVYELTATDAGNLPVAIDVPLGAARKLQLVATSGAADAASRATEAPQIEVTWASARIIAGP